MNDAPFSSECPKCHQDRVLAYSREELTELLRAGAEIEAWCVSCDEHWMLATDERADITRGLERHR